MREPTSSHASSRDELRSSIGDPVVARATREHQVQVRLISPAAMEAEIGAANVYGYSEPELLTFSTGIQCRYPAATVAHEVAHVWQFRATSAGDLYAAVGHDHAEIVAAAADVRLIATAVISGLVWLGCVIVAASR
ncbi:hypothetical protein [Amycolatopsis sp. EV170708-02-1]|uniref:hypothetical protein n=1 Tax=Amycolatopsis sp. EV170708-02-1 TaxID=2919322 RepID=UPI001F0CA3D8|nr:hypothetical protein [Amycolatopsis sp. EV170708-02-1]UMP05575.1 hypothetical protein MJQ72_12415 [Amycolatopsis sp. EV170708-02-1]